MAGKVTMLPAPTFYGKLRINPTIGAAGTAIAASTKNPDAAWKLFEYYHSGEPAIARAKSGWGVPALKSLYPLMPQQTAFQRQVQATRHGGLILASRWLKGSLGWPARLADQVFTLSYERRVIDFKLYAQDNAK